MSGTLTISGVQTVASGEKNIGPLNIPMGTVGSVTDVTLGLGANTIAVPSLSKGCVIVPPAGTTSTVTLTLKGAAADVGVAISSINPTTLTFDTAPASFVLTASAAMSASTEITFF